MPTAPLPGSVTLDSHDRPASFLTVNGEAGLAALKCPLPAQTRSCAWGCDCDMPQKPAASAHEGSIFSLPRWGKQTHDYPGRALVVNYDQCLVLCALEIRSGLGSASKLLAPYKSAPFLCWNLPGQDRSAESHPPLPPEKTVDRQDNSVSRPNPAQGRGPHCASHPPACSSSDSPSLTRCFGLKMPSGFLLETS